MSRQAASIKHAYRDENQDVAAEAVRTTKCPTCEASPGNRCINTKADEKGRHRPVPVHRKRIAAYVIF